MSGAQFVQRGQALIDRKQFQEAVKVCRLGLLASPAEVAGRLVLATALCALERYDEVLAEMRVALELEPRSARAHVLKASALLRKGDALQAREILDRASELDPHEPGIDAMRGEANELLGASGKPRSRVATAGLVDDDGDGFTKHYPAHMGAVVDGGSITRPHDGLAPDPDDILPPPDVLSVGDRSGTIELDPEIEGIEVSPVDDDALADPPLPAPSEVSDVVELDTGDVELVTGSEVASLQALHDASEEPTAYYTSRPGPAGKRPAGPAQRPSEPTIPESPFASLRRQAHAELGTGGPELDALFPENESGVSSIDLSQAPVSGSIETPPSHDIPGQPSYARSRGTFDDGGPSIPSLAGRGVVQTSAAPSSHTRETRESRPPRSRTEDMKVIKEGLGIEDTGDSRARRNKRRRKDRTRGVAAGRSRAGGRSFMWLYALVAIIVVAGAVFAGLKVRQARLDRQVKRALRDAQNLAESDTYRGYWAAARAYDNIHDAQNDASTRGALARIEAAIAAEFGENRERAAELVGKLGDANGLDALAARTYLAVAAGDIAAAKQTSSAIVGAFPDQRIGHYLAGRAALLDGEPEAAAEAFRTALGKQPSPAAYVGLGVAESSIGNYAEALAAYDAALNLSPEHPGALIERARVLVRTHRLPEQDEPEQSLDEIRAESRKPIEDQPRGVSREQAGWASLALAEVALARGDRAGAKQALEDAVGSRPLDDWRFSDALADAYLATGNVEKSRAEAERAAKKWPGRATGFIRLAETALAAGDPAQGLEALAKVPNIEKRPDALAARGRARMMLNDVDQAAADLDAALAVRPNLRAAQIARAEVDLHRGDVRGAVQRLQPLYDAAESPDIGIVYASALRRSGERERARSVLERALESPQGAGAHIELARLDRDEGKFKEARRNYAKAIESDPTGVTARLEAAQLNLDMGDVGGAREALDQLAKDAPDNGSVLVAAARVHTLTGDPDGAGAMLDRAEKMPTTPRWRIHYERGRMLLRTQRAKQAVAELESAVSLQPDDGEMRLLLLDAYLTAEDGKGANAALTDVLKRFANRPVADLALGRVHLFNDRLGDAMISFKDARRTLDAERAPPRRLAEAEFWIGRVHYFDGSLGSARSSLEAAVKLNPGNADAFYVLGQVQQERGKLKQAVAAWERCTRTDGTGIPDAWFLLGETQAKLRRKADAKAALEKYLELAPAGDYVTEAKDLLDGL